MEYLHTMIRVTDLDQSLDFFCNKLGMVEIRRSRNEKGPLHAGLPRRAGRCRTGAREARAARRADL
jgi:catechol 2,3-dioxygenase-like lactoylglutathione lyase family enzyme